MADDVFHVEMVVLVAAAGVTLRLQDAPFMLRRGRFKACSMLCLCSLHSVHVSPSL